VDEQRYGSSVSVLDYIVRHQIEGIKPRNIVDFGAGGGKNGRLIKNILGKNCSITAIEG
jgi:hypothetical protein